MNDISYSYASRAGKFLFYFHLYFLYSWKKSSSRLICTRAGKFRFTFICSVLFVHLKYIYLFTYIQTRKNANFFFINWEQRLATVGDTSCISRRHVIKDKTLVTYPTSLKWKKCPLQCEYNKLSTTMSIYGKKITYLVIYVEGNRDPWNNIVIIPIIIIFIRMLYFYLFS